MGDMHFMYKIFLLISVIYYGEPSSLKAMQTSSSQKSEENKGTLSVSHRPSIPIDPEASSKASTPSLDSLVEETTGLSPQISALIVEYTASMHSSFKSLTVAQYIKRCMPKLPQESFQQAVSIFNSLVKDGTLPIQEDDGGNSNDNLGKTKTESGYTFPPIMELQGPFLEYCGNGKFKRVLDIGSGEGNDTIPLLLTNNVQVVAVDIHARQLAALKSRVTSKLSSVPVALKHFASFKRDFADNTITVPQQYKGGFQAVNLSRVAHFLTGTQLATLVGNIAETTDDEAVLSLVVSTYLPSSREAQWVALQEKQGLEDPGLVYYDYIKPLKTLFLPGTYQFVARKDCTLPSPGHKVEFLTHNQTKLVLRTGKYYHTLSSLNKYLSPHFNITDHTTVAVDAEDVFLAVLAKKKPLKK
jgi:SAM-dependent methyltransferase